MAKKLSAEDKAMYASFCAEFYYCWCCGSSRRNSYHVDVDYPFALHCAHIVGGPSRKHDRRVLTRLCMLCHSVQHGHSVRNLKTRELLPPITKENLLWLKWSLDPASYDLEFVMQCSVRRFEPEQPDVFYRQMFDQNRGCLREGR